MASILATPDELAEIRSVDAARKWAGLSDQAWAALEKNLGSMRGMPGLRILASLPSPVLQEHIQDARVEPDGRVLTAVEIASAKLMWRVARQAVGLPEQAPVAAVSSTSGSKSRSSTKSAQAVVTSQRRKLDSRSAEETIRQLEEKLRKALEEMEALEKQALDKKLLALEKTRMEASWPSGKRLQLSRVAAQPLELKWRREGPSPSDVSVRGLAYAGGPDANDAWQPCIGQTSGDDRPAILIHPAMVCDAAIAIPVERWQHDEFYDPNPKNTEKAYAQHGVFLADMESFDRVWFKESITKAQAKIMDPQARKCIEAARMAWLSSDITMREWNLKDDTSVNVGVMTNDWIRMHDETGQRGEILKLNPPNMYANWVNYVNDFKGPSATVDTADSSSLVATNLCAADIRFGRCGLSLALGVCHMGTPDTFIQRCGMQLLSKNVNGRSAPFDARANGYCRGEGYGCLVLSKHGDAQPGQASLGLIVGYGTNEDGQSSTLTTPSGPAQAMLLRNTHRAAGLELEEVTLLEASATGSKMNDAIEFGALVAMHGRHPLVLGSVKPATGHTEGSAGLAGLVKSFLLVNQRVCLPLQHLYALSPLVEQQLERSGKDIEFPIEHMEFSFTGLMAAGVSAFGLGTNAHVIIASWGPEHYTRQLMDMPSDRPSTEADVISAEDKEVESKVAEEAKKTAKRKAAEEELPEAERKAKQVIRVAGAGGNGSATNGLYKRDGFFNGKPKYRQSEGASIIYWSTGWKIMTDNNTQRWCYRSEMRSATPPVAQWRGIVGADPVPAVSYVQDTSALL